MPNGGMNKLVKILAILALLPLGVLVPTLSLESYYSNTTKAQSATSEALQERVAEYKESLTTELSNAQQDRIKLRCQAAQTAVKTLAVTTKTALENRNNKYSELIASLKDLQTKLTAQGVDASGLETSLKALETKYGEFETSSDTFNTTLGDVSEVDCTEDPVAFKASLEAAKNDQAVLRTTALEIKALLQETIKADLQTIRVILVSEETTEDTNTTPESTEPAEGEE